MRDGVTHQPTKSGQLERVAHQQDDDGQDNDAAQQLHGLRAAHQLKQRKEHKRHECNVERAEPVEALCKVQRSDMRFQTPGTPEGAEAKHG